MTWEWISDDPRRNSSCLGCLMGSASKTFCYHSLVRSRSLMPTFMWWMSLTLDILLFS